MENLIFIGDLAKYLDKGYEKRLTRLLKECQRLEKMELPETHPNGSSTYMGIAIVNLSLCYLLTKEDWLLDEAKRWMKTVLGYEKWGNAHLVNVDLSASWILWGLSLGYDWLNPYLGEEFSEAVSNKIAHHAKIIYDYAKENRKGWPVNYSQNHNWINFNGLATAGYALVKNKNIGQEYIDESAENFTKVFELMPSDGSNYEGVTYWRYGGMWLFVYAHLAKTHSDVDYFKTSKYLENTFNYRLHQSAGDKSLQIDFGDCHDRHSCHTVAIYYKVASEYKNGYARTYGDIVLDNYLEDEANLSKVKPGILPEAGLELLFFDPEVLGKPLDELEKTAFFDDLGLLSTRTDFSDNATVFSFKCGAPGGKIQWEGYHSGKYEGMEMSLSHHHPDNLSYVLCKGKDYFTREDGYNRNILPTHHSVLLVDGMYTDVSNVNDVYRSAYKIREQDGKYVGYCEKIELSQDFIAYKGTNTEIYPLDLKMDDVSRTVIAPKELEFVVMLNAFSSREKHVFEVVCNTENKMSKDTKNSYETELSGEKSNYYIFSDKETNERQFMQKVEAVMTTQEPDKVCVTEINTLITHSNEKCMSQNFVEVITTKDGICIENIDGKISISAKDKVEIVLGADFYRFGITEKGNFAISINEEVWRVL